MAVEKFIHGKQDSCKHDGLYANRKRLQQAEYSLQDYLNDPTPIEIEPLKTEGVELEPDTILRLQKELIYIDIFTGKK